MPHRILVVVTVALAIMLSDALAAQRGAAEPPGMGARTIGRPMTVVSGSLTGTVRDQARALVAGIQVTVILETDANVQPHWAATDMEGRFRFTGLPLGRYCLIVGPRGSEVTRRTGVQVRGAQTTNVPIVLGEPVPTPTVAREARELQKTSCSQKKTP